jgi:hypothetical protein
MALLGKGVLAIWNGIEPEAEDAFVAWHIQEHIPERIGVPGFLRGRRYVALDGHPQYFNFYETGTVEDLTSCAYQAKLNAPSEWTRRVVARFQDTSRTICDVAWSIGLGEGGYIEAITLDSAGLPGDLFQFALRDQLGSARGAVPGLVGIHLLEGHAGTGHADTVEKQLRGTADKVAAWILLVEASSPEPLWRFRSSIGSDAMLVRCGAGTSILRGIYQLQFALTKAELAWSSGEVCR